MSREKVALKVNNIGHSITHKNSYTVVLSEIGGSRYIPLVVGAFEAQAIAVALENMKPTRPLTHDLVKNIFDACDIELQQVIMTSQSEGVFYSSLVCKQNDKVITLDSRTSDALALALRFGCPIFTYEDILLEVGISGAETKKKEVGVIDSEKEKTSNSASKEDVKKRLKKALDDEDYELAAKLRDELSSLE